MKAADTIPFRVPCFVPVARTVFSLSRMEHGAETTWRRRRCASPSGGIHANMN